MHKEESHKGGVNRKCKKNSEARRFDSADIILAKEVLDSLDMLLDTQLVPLCKIGFNHGGTIKLADGRYQCRASVVGE